MIINSSLLVDFGSTYKFKNNRINQKYNLI